MPEGSVKDKEEDRSNIGFVGARVDHSYDVCETLDVTADGKVLLLWDGTNDQGTWEGVYISRREDDEDALIVLLDPEGRAEWSVGVSGSTSDERQGSCLHLFASFKRGSILSVALNK